MSDLKIILFKKNRVPRTLSVNSQLLYKTAAVLGALSAFTVLATALAVHFYLHGRANSSDLNRKDQADSLAGPTNNPEEIIASLRDQNEQLRTQVENSKTALNAPKELEKKNPLFALFSPVVSDQSQSQQQVEIRNFKVSSSGNPSGNKNQTLLSFELHNKHSGESTEKGYIVVLGRAESAISVYPSAVQKGGPYLIDFEKGETFQVARFRMVNAQFDSLVKTFQIMIFTRTGELLINHMHEARE